MNNQVIGKYSGKAYNPDDAIRIVNTSQALLYWLNKVEPLDIYPSRNYETKKPVLVFVFDRESTKTVYDLWCKYELC